MLPELLAELRDRPTRPLGVARPPRSRAMHHYVTIIENAVAAAAARPRGAPAPTDVGAPAHIPRPCSYPSDVEVIGTAEAAAVLNCSPQHVRRLAATKQLAGQRTPDGWRFLAPAVRARATRDDDRRRRK